MELNYGMIAVAAISSRFAGAVRECGGTVAAAASRTLEKAQMFCRENQIAKAYGSYEELYADPDISIVYIATPNQTHGEEIRKALAAGKHVLCEKPLALSEQEARELFALAENSGRFMMEMQKSVFLPVAGLVKDYIRNLNLGKLHQVDMCASFASPAAAWMHEPQQGGVVYGSASYTLEYLDYLLEPEETQVQAFGTREDTGAVDAVSINIKMDDILINSRITMRAPAVSEAVFYFEKGSIRVPDYWKARRCEIQTAAGISRHEFPAEYEMKYEVEHVMTCLEKGWKESPVMSVARTIKCCRLADEIMSLV